VIGRRVTMNRAAVTETHRRFTVTGCRATMTGLRSRKPKASSP
jgi:hypothetical protein